MAANGKNENTEATESTETADVADVQVLFKVSPQVRDALKVVALIEKVGEDTVAGNVQTLFERISAQLVEKHSAKLEMLFADSAA